MTWPEEGVLPRFAKPAPLLQTAVLEGLSPDEQLTLVGLQGVVNRTEPRIYLLKRSSRHPDRWAETQELGLAEVPESWLALVERFREEVSGVVRYDPETSPHYRNVAGTVAGMKGALPVTDEVFAKLKEAGVDLPVVADLSAEKASSPVEIYLWMHGTYWADCEKRVILSAKPFNHRGPGDFHHTRDLAAATGAAVVWLDCRIPEEREVMRLFFQDMKAGESVALGWYASERSGITTASESGISTLPSDYYQNSTVHSGVANEIAIPAVPKLPELANKVYISLYISDGDNIQYCQNAMRGLWDRSAEDRGKMPLNWTIAPGLVDIGPGLLNYYYRTATSGDCFVTGPSGMGYLMPTNTLEEPGAPVGVYLKDSARMDGYASLTETYLRRSGLRVVTIWDNASAMQRASYEKNSPSLYGATVQNFKDDPTVASSVEGGRVPFERLVLPYAGSFEHLTRELRNSLRQWEGDSPLFLSAQVEVWKELRPHRLLAVKQMLETLYPGQIEFVRADHYFQLRNASQGLPFNLSLLPSTRSEPEAARATLDGTPTSAWTGDSLVISLAESRQFSRALLTSEAVTLSCEVSSDGKEWQSVFEGPTTGFCEISCPPVAARFIRFQASAPIEWREVEVYGH
ncbi:GxGYxYP domain-containing protein [Roseibacillus ishigakijimensis]|uniref:F5/8 type C domain-containing protein n=1 Tax=Roseibacillus ishigakijimensis TaxID=454146 RepID=A0A934RLI4_9BACT|nr:GxGYxYP domain-containing protein [Roseibacillus ishigakijimensis]MBK1832975.1 hypothetical protein [Roseibacillus ishigakijimensis]